MARSKLLAAGFLLLFLAGVCSTQAGTKTWTAAAGTNDWFVNANWNSGVGPAPVAGDDVIIASNGAFVLLTNSTPYLSSLTLSNTLIFSNWNTTLSATNITIQTNGVMTLPAAFTTNAGVMSNNVYVLCSNLTIAAGGKIDADAKGYLGGIIGSGTKPGYGPGAGTGNGAGSYGGMGYSGGPTYGSISAPIDPGSGSGTLGDGGGGPGAPGGGAVRIQAGGLVTVDGTITANGGTPSGRSGGSGGSIYITTRTLGGNNGIIRANGAKGGSDDGGGGGGRIAIIYDSSAQSLLPVPTIRFSVSGAAGGVNRPTAAYYSDIGTLYFPDTLFWGAETISHSGQLFVPGFTNWAPNSLTISNGWIRFPWDAFQLTVTNAVTVIGTNAGLCKLEVSRLNCGNSIVLTNGALVIKGVAAMPVLNCGSNLALNNTSTFTVYSIVSNTFGLNYGALVSIVGDVTVATNSWIYPWSNPTNGGSALFRMRNLTLNVGGGIDADSKGYQGAATSRVGYGPGASTDREGASSYGGVGGYLPGLTYGSSNAPIDPGSGGGSLGDTPGAYGGGAVRIQASGIVTIDGLVTANGGKPSGRSGGSGGGIYITTRSVGGNNGTVRANGGQGGVNGGGGGGGRIAIWRAKDSAVSSFTNYVDGGLIGGNPARPAGLPGTIVWGQLPVPGTVFFGR